MKTDVLIIGGGVTGLSLASFLKKDYLIIEQDNQVGGYCKTTRRNGFVWDYSGHFFHFKNEDIKNYLLENMECDVLNINRDSNIYYNGQYIDFPFQWNIDQLPQNEFIACLHDLYHAVPNRETHSFKDHVRSTLGDAICDKFIIPYNEKLYACDLNKLDVNAMGRFFPKEVSFPTLLDKLMKKEKIGSYNDTLIYPEFGSFEFIKSILKRVDNSKIHLNTPLVEVDFENKIATTNKGKIEYNTIVNTIPFNRFSLFDKHNRVETIKLTSNKVVVFNLGFDRGTKLKSHWTYFPNHEIFYRIGFYNNILNHEKMSLYVEIGMNRGEPIPSNLLNIVLFDLKKCGIIEDHKLIDHECIVMDPAYVHITEESNQMYSDWCSLHNPMGVYSIGRFGSWTYCSIEDNIIQAKGLSTQI